MSWMFVALLASCVRAPPPSEAVSVRVESLDVPEALNREHDALRRELRALSGAPGRVGAAARDLADVMVPHLQHEQELALPPLAVLDELVQGVLAAEDAAEAERMSALLEAALPQMIEEHLRVRLAVEALAEAAREEGDAEALAFAQQLRTHAELEEQVLYPAAVLVGRFLRARPGV